MLYEKRVNDFIVRPVEQVTDCLNQGYYLYGHTLYHPNNQRFYQALVKCASPNVRITAGEARCLQWALRGKTAGETAAIVGTTRSTVHKHLASLRRKFDCVTMRQVIVKASEMGLIVNEKVCLLAEDPKKSG